MYRSVSARLIGPALRTFGSAALVCMLAMCGGQEEGGPHGAASLADGGGAGRASGRGGEDDGAAGFGGGGGAGIDGSAATDGARHDGSAGTSPDASGDGGSDAGLDPNLGFSCGGDLCLPGNRCVQCGPAGSIEWRCVPRPDVDPAGYAAAVQDCELRSSNSGQECDGPEDCLSGEYCSATTLRCDGVPTPLPTFCCFSCGAPPGCDYCRSDSDCPVNGTCISEFGANDLGGCLRRGCETSADCPVGWFCTDHFWSPGDSYCHFSCADGGACPGQERCLDGYCR